MQQDGVGAICIANNKSGQSAMKAQVRGRGVLVKFCCSAD